MTGRNWRRRIKRLERARIAHTHNLAALDAALRRLGANR